MTTQIHIPRYQVIRFHHGSPEFRLLCKLFQFALLMLPSVTVAVHQIYQVYVPLHGKTTSILNHFKSPWRSKRLIVIVSSLVVNLVQKKKKKKKKHTKIPTKNTRKSFHALYNQRRAPSVWSAMSAYWTFLSPMVECTTLNDTWTQSLKLTIQCPGTRVNMIKKRIDDRLHIHFHTTPRSSKSCTYSYLLHFVSYKTLTCLLNITYYLWKASNRLCHKLINCAVDVQCTS